MAGTPGGADGERLLGLLQGKSSLKQQRATLKQERAPDYSIQTNELEFRCIEFRHPAFKRLEFRRCRLPLC
jgi:hypothetical protein